MYRPEKRTFRTGQPYTLTEIKEMSRTYTEPELYRIDKDDPGTIHVVATADHREYWFVKDGEEWAVDHVWTSYELAENESGGD